jgi:hypothetical protein
MLHTFNVANTIEYLILDDGLGIDAGTINKAKSNDG